jgi:CHAT domain-containing protein
VVEEGRSVVDAATATGVCYNLVDSLAKSTEAATSFQDTNVLHLACHGLQDQSNPLNSRFCLHNRDLMASDLIKMRLDHGFLAYLSACETAKGDVKHTDEVIHLAATMLAAGYKSVVATMW